jgi:long-chain acyl-CoA synthetase
MLNQLFDKAALAHSDAMAIVCEDRRITFFELQLYVEWMAGYFQSIALRPSQRVAMLIPNSPELVITFFGLMRAGGVAVPLEVTSPERDLCTALMLAEAGAVITTPEYKTLLDKVLAQAGPALSSMTIAVFEEDNIVTLRHPARERPNAAADSTRNGKATAPNHLAPQGGVVSLPAPNGKAHAGGTAPIFAEHPALIDLAATKAGPPKLRIRTHAELVGEAERLIAGLKLTSADHLFCAAPLCLHGNFSHGLIAVIAAGATLVILASRDWGRILQALAEERITVLAPQGGVLARLAETESRQDGTEISALQWCFCLDAPLSPELCERLNKKIGFHVWSFADSKAPVIPPQL